MSVGRSVLVAAVCGWGIAAPLPAQDLRRVGDSSVSGEGRLTRVVDAVPLRGREVRLRAALRFARRDDPDAPFGGCPAGGPLDAPPCDPGAYLWLRPDGPPASGPGQELRSGPIVSPDWSVEEIRTTIPEDALDLYLGVFLAGDGRMWADDLQLAVREADGRWHRLPLPNGDFENVGQTGTPAEWGGIDPPYEARIDRDSPWQGSGAVRIERTTP